MWDQAGNRLPYNGIVTDEPADWETGHNTYELPVEEEDDATDDTVEDDSSSILTRSDVTVFSSA